MEKKKVLNLVYLSIWCFVHAKKHMVSKSGSQYHDSLTQLQTAGVTHTTYSRNQSRQLARWGYDETGGQTRRSNLTVLGRVAFLVPNVLKEKWVATIYYQRIWKPRSQTTRETHEFFRPQFLTKLILKPNTVHLFILGTRWLTRKFIFLVFYLLTMSIQICIVLDEDSPPSTWWFMSNANRIFYTAWGCWQRT